MNTFGSWLLPEADPQTQGLQAIQLYRDLIGPQRMALHAHVDRRLGTTIPHGDGDIGAVADRRQQAILDVIHADRGQATGCQLLLVYGCDALLVERYVHIMRGTDGPLSSNNVHVPDSITYHICDAFLAELDAAVAALNAAITQGLAARG